MGLKGRARRLRNFLQRARAFERDSFEQKGFNVQKRDGRRLTVGVGKHRRLVQKNVSRQANVATVYAEKLFVFLKTNNISPKYYKLERLAFDPETGVQEYFNRPSALSLIHFLNAKENQLRQVLGKTDANLCKKFMGEFPKVTLEKIDKAKEELFEHLKGVTEYPQVESNILVIGQTRNGKLRLAIVDV